MNFRPLSERDSDLLCELFRSQAEERDAWVWQDRSPAFFALYHTMKCGSAPLSYYGGFDESGKLVASSGAVQTEMRWAGKARRFQYETDYYVEERSRCKRIGWGILEKRLEETYAPRGEFSSSVFFAIENQSGLFSPEFVALWKKHHGDCLFPVMSTLHEIYLLPLKARTFGDNRIEALSIQSASDRELARFINGYDQCHSQSVLSALLSVEKIRHLGVQYPDAKLYLTLEGQAVMSGALVLDMLPARRFRWTGKPSLMQARLRQTRALDESEFASGAVFKNRVISFVWNEPGQESSLASLLDQIYQDAYTLGYHALIARDLPQFYPDLLTPYDDHTLHYSRRLLLTIREEDQESHEIVQAALANRSRWILEPVFL